LTLQVTSFTNNSGKTASLAAPKPKTILFNAATRLQVRGDISRQISLSQLKIGAHAFATGIERGSGQPLLARTVAVWQREQDGKYFYEIPITNPPATIPAKIQKTPPDVVPATTGIGTRKDVPNELPIGDFQTIENGIPSGWTLRDNKGIQIIEEDNDNRFLMLTPAMDAAALHARIPVSPHWKRIRTYARMRVRNLQPGTQEWQLPRIGLQCLGEADKPLGYLAAPALFGDSDWQTVSVDAAIPSGTTFLFIEPTMSGVKSGELSIDDIRIVANPAPEALPLRTGVPNGDFEGVDATRQPLTWKLTDPRRMSIVEENGNRFLRISNENPPVSLALPTWFQLDPAWNGLKVSVRMRANNLGPGKQPWENARLSLELQDAAGERAGPYLTVPELKQDSDWVVKSTTLLIPDTAEFIRIQPALLMATGTVDFDDITVEPIAVPNAAPRALPIRGDAPESTFDTANDRVAGWNLGQGSTIEIEQGNHFLRMINDNAAATVGAEARFRLPAGWTSVRIRAKLRAPNLEVGPNPRDLARLDWSFEDANRARIGNIPESLTLKQAGDWATREVLAVVPQGATLIRIAPKLAQASGTFDVDDIEIEDIKD
jgi:hypothetical protein